MPRKGQHSGSPKLQTVALTATNLCTRERAASTLCTLVPSSKGYVAPNSLLGSLWGLIMQGRRGVVTQTWTDS